jgi:hypothetical protein
MPMLSAKPTGHVSRECALSSVKSLLLFAIKMATLPFWAQIKNLRTRHREAHKFRQFWSEQHDFE